MSISDLTKLTMGEEKVMNSNSYNIAVIGAGHVGLVAAACFAQMGNKVTCIDNDTKRISQLKKLIMPFYEPQLSALVKKNFKKKRLFFSHSLSAVKKCEVIFIAVGTPPNSDGSADLTAVETVAREIARNLNSYKLVVEKSTVPVQTGKKIQETINKFKKNKVEFDVASNPEFLREGKAVYDFFNPQRIVLGVSSKKAANILRHIYRGFKAPFVVTDISTAEIIKHACNSFLSTKISFINAVARVCDLAGADINKVAQAMGLDKRIGKQFLDAGIGFGGFCFPKDLEAFYYISRQLGYDFRLLKEVIEINKQQSRYLVQKIKDKMWVVKGKKIAVLGLAFKPDTDDMRFAPAIDIIDNLHREGAKLYLYDPQALSQAKELFKKKKNIFFKQSALDAAKGCDCACFLTEWEEFKNINLSKLKKAMNYPLIADGRNMFGKNKLQRMGFDYIGIGR